jgi:hypothetical protein
MVHFVSLVVNIKLRIIYYTNLKARICNKSLLMDSADLQSDRADLQPHNRKETDRKNEK